MRRTPTANTLFYGDNLNILRTYIEDESVDLVYLDPPFNSNATYNVLFRSPTGESSQAQIEAFDDTWHWNFNAERAFDEVVQSGNSEAANLLIALRSFLGENDMMAYLAMMAVRLIELHRVLKPTGSLYLHCDPTASHYLKLLLDSVFGVANFRNHITWKRSAAHGDSKARFGRVSDHILFYSKSRETPFHRIFGPHSEAYLNAEWRTLPDGRRYKTENMLDPQNKMAAYEFHGTTAKWRYVPAKMQALWNAADTGVPESHGRIKLGRDGTPTKRCRIVFLSELEGSPVQDFWDDISYIAGGAGERLGYPTQKPTALLERILSASSSEGDLVLDPFCGCGTTVHAAQKLGRRWIGIDITHLAIGLIQRRLTEAFPLAAFDILGVPKDAGAAAALAESDKHQFQLWALSMVEAQPYKGGQKGADGGVDGYIFFKPDGKRTEKAIVSVKGGAHVADTMVKDLITTVDHEKAAMGVFITLAPPTRPMVARAAAAGVYRTEYGEFPKVQILTIAELFDGRRPHMPWLDPTVFRKAKREAAPDGQGALDI